MMKKSFLLVISLVFMFSLSGCPDENQSEKEDESEKIPNEIEKASEELEQIITLLGGPVFDSREKIEQIKNQQVQILSAIISKKPDQTTLGTDKITEEGDSRQSEKNEEGDAQEKDNKSDKGEEEGQSKEENEDKGGEEEKEAGEKENSGEKTGQKPSDTAEIKAPFQLNDSLFGIPKWNEDNWKMIKVLTDGLHFTWNSLQPELTQKGVSSNQTLHFAAALEELTQSVRDQKKNEAQVSAFHMTEALAAFSSYYKTKKPPELQRIKSNTVGIHFFVTQSDWDRAQDLSNQLQLEVEKLRAGAPDNSSSVFQMLEFSLTDLSKSVQSQDIALVLLRTNLVTANLMELEDEYSQNQ